ncbi:TIGR03085 family metal-binding protein [Pseudonocardia phyllosphaerae]|uniref:TIGR03085 family metal-binding protein n=1 Tax=Pseudonocardia phyllosphaerae TaxID=3390502 RepID=UPI00397C5C8E
MSLASDERAALCDEFERSGPDRPTLCEGWNAHDLLTHLLVRERQPWNAAGMFVPALSSFTDKAMASYEREAWPNLIDDLRKGPPPWSPFKVGKVDELANGGEFFVHHEDLRRGEPGWEPRPADAARDGMLWNLLSAQAKLLFRRSPVGVVLTRPEGAQLVVATGPGLVTVSGEPSELVLHAFGRDAARVEITGLPADVEAYRAAPSGL